MLPALNTTRMLYYCQDDSGRKCSSSFKDNKCITKTCIGNKQQQKYFTSYGVYYQNLTKLIFTNLLIRIVNTGIHQTLLDQITGHLMSLLEILGCWATQVSCFWVIIIGTVVTKNPYYFTTASDALQYQHHHSVPPFVATTHTHIHAHIHTIKN